MARHDRLYYRAHSSGEATTWVSPAVSLPDEVVAGAPYVHLCDCWVLPSEVATDAEVAAALAAAANHPQFDVIDGGLELAALVCLHRFSPHRPMDPSRLEWVVVLQSTAAPLQRTLVQRLDFTGKALIAAHVLEERLDRRTSSTSDANLVAALETDAQRWRKRSLGPFTVFQDNAPLPGEDGGTCVTLASSSRCVYFAWTAWSGQPEAILPR
jgi:hypothetical protein